MRRLLRWTLWLVAIAYPLAIAAIVLGLALIGERWWPTTVALYLPRALFALPLPLIALALLIWGPRWLLVAQAIAAALILFPLMGLELGGATPQASTRMRILSYNVDFGQISRPAIRDEIVAAGADVILLQASDQRIWEPLGATTLAGMETRRVGEFFIASRYHILDLYLPPTIDGHDAGFVRATLDTPLGPLDVYSVHPKSPRRGFEAIRGEGLGEEIATGHVLSGDGTDKVERNASLRRRQVEAIAAHARGARNPVVIAGDTNLPGLSPLLRQQLGDYQDGFAEVGRGFGYTFPAHRWMPWMRIDRILAGPELVFVSFQVGRRRGSDHYAVIAELARR